MVDNNRIGMKVFEDFMTASFLGIVRWTGILKDKIMDDKMIEEIILPTNHSAFILRGLTQKQIYITMILSIE